MERMLLRRYEEDLDLIVRSLDARYLEAATALAAIPQLIRGYGHVKQASVVVADAERMRVMPRLTAAARELVADAAE